MGKICLQCGDKGSANAFVYCVICLKFVVHRYCLDVIPKTMDEIVHWVCGEDCEGLAQNLSIERDHGRIPSHIRDCVVSNKVKGTRNKVVLTKFHKDSPKILHDAESDSDKNSNEHVPMLDLPILSPKEEENIFPLVAKKKKGKVSGRKRLLNGGPEKTKKKKTGVIIQEEGIKNNADLPNLLLEDEKNILPLEAKKKGKVSGRKRLLNGGPEKTKKKKPVVITQEEGVKNKADLPILSLEDEKNILPLEAKKKKGKVSGRKRLLNGGPEKIKRKKTKVIIQSSTRNDERGLENIVPPKKDSEEGVIRSSKKKNNNKKKNKKKTAVTSKQIIVSCEDNDSPSQVQVRSNLELEVYNNDPCGGFQKDYLHAEPVAMPIWRGSFDIWNGKDYILNGLLAHLSILACQKVFDEACQFQPVLRFEMLPKSDVWPKSFETMNPSGDSIALYFFPSKSSERDFDRLVEEMKQRELALKAVVHNAELLVFDSSELPLLYWKFQGKYYLWGVFRQKQSTPSNSFLKTNDKNPIKHAEKTSTRLKGCNVLSPKSPLSISASNGSDA